MNNTLDLIDGEIVTGNLDCHGLFSIQLFCCPFSMVYLMLSTRQWTSDPTDCGLDYIVHSKKNSEKSSSVVKKTFVVFSNAF